MNSSLDTWIDQALRSRSRSDGLTFAKTITQIPVTSIFPEFEASSQASIPILNNPDLAIVTANEANKKGLTCLLCSLTFQSYTDQVVHFKSDFHNYNLKRKVKNEPSVTEDEFLIEKGKENDEENANDDDENSTSSSSSEDSDKDDEMIDYKRYEYQDDYGKIVKVFHPVNGPMFNIELKHLAPWQFLMSIAAFTKDSNFQNRDWNLPTAAVQHGRSSIWHSLYKNLSQLQANPLMAVFILRSGRFAGAIFNNQRVTASADTPTVKNPSLIAHRVFRRYTVRAKGGGGQASYDSQQGKANSMGAQLRRYGEKALQEDIEELFVNWKEYLGQCGLILIASTKRMRFKLFNDSEGNSTETTISSSKSGTNSGSPLLSKNDPRVSLVPFMVDKPTIESLFMIRNKVTQVTFHQKLDNIVPPSAAMEENTSKSSKMLPIPPIPPVTSQPTKNELENDIELLRTNSLLVNPYTAEIFNILEMAKDDSEARENLKTFIDNHFNEINTNQQTEGNESDEEEDDDDDEEEEENQGGVQGRNYFAQRDFSSKDGQHNLQLVINTPLSMETLTTPLHLASMKSFPSTIEYLLYHQSNPTILDSHGRTPYFLSTAKACRDSYRKMRSKLGSAAYQWAKTGIPDELTNEMIAKQKEKTKLKKKKKQQKKKEKKVLTAEQEKKDADLAKQLQEEEEKSYLLTIQQQEYHKSEKEMLLLCDYCRKNIDLARSNEIYTLDQHPQYSFCSVNCMNLMRRKIMADAAMSRFQSP
jgi:hypothetical protein